MLVRTVSNGAVSLATLEETVSERLLKCMGNIRRARLKPALSGKRAPPGARVFFHLVSAVADCSADEIPRLRLAADRAIQKLRLANAEDLVRLDVDAIEVQVWVSATAADGAPKLIPVPWLQSWFLSQS